MGNLNFIRSKESINPQEMFQKTDKECMEVIPEMQE